MRYNLIPVPPFYHIEDENNVKIYIEVPDYPLSEGLFHFSRGYHFFINGIEEVKDIFEDYLVLSVFLPGLNTLSLDIKSLFKEDHVKKVQT